MPLKAWSGSAWVMKPLKWWNGSAWAQKPLKRWNGSAWVLVSGISSVTAAPGSLFGNAPTSTVTTDPTFVTVTGGSGSYTYAWSQIDGLGGAITINSPTASSTTFIATGMPVDGEREGAFVCTVTDTASGQVVVSNQVSVFITRTI